MFTNNLPTPRLSGSTLKLIAITTMLIDHIGAVVIETGILHSYDTNKLMEIVGTEYGKNWYILDLFLRLIGRIAFPIFCFLLVEGFLHTHNVKRYFMNLFVFAIISEVPFDMAVMNRGFSMKYQNVYFTLLIGLLTLIFLKRFEGQKLLQLLTVFLGCAAARLMKSDYEVIGILMISCLYLLRSNRKKQFLVSGIIMFLESLTLFGAAVLALIPIHFYSGEKGNTGNKYIFYWFYPVHLFLLLLIRYFIIGVHFIK